MDKPNISSKEMEILPRGSKIIRVSCEKSKYSELVEDNQKFKTFLNKQIEKHPEIFPERIASGYTLYGKGRCSAKLDKLQFRRIRINDTGEIFNVYPSFVMPYLIAYTFDVEKGLLLRKHDVPYSTLVYLFGHDEMYWHRAEKAFGRCSIVGTTIKKKISYPKILLGTKNTRN